MKVKELIGLLQDLNPEQEVLLTGYEGGYYNAGRIRAATVALDWNDEWYYGPHEIVDEYLLEQAQKQNVQLTTQEAYILY